MLCFPSTVGVVNYSFQSYLKPGRCYTSYQLLDLASVASRATKILSTVGVDIYVDLSFQGYQNPIKLKSWHTCSFRAPGRCYASGQLSELTTVAFRATLKNKNIIGSLFNFKFLLLLLLLWVTQPLENTYTKTLQNFFCQIEVSFIVESFLIGKPWNFRQIHVRSLELSNYTIMLLSPLPW